MTVTIKMLHLSWLNDQGTYCSVSVGVTSWDKLPAEEQCRLLRLTVRKLNQELRIGQFDVTMQVQITTLGSPTQS